MCSVYIPSSSTNEDETRRTCIRRRLDALRTTIQRERLNFPELELIIAGDFNRYDVMWGGDTVAASPRQGEAADLIDFMDEHELLSNLERGTITFRNPRGDESTLDLVLTSVELANEVQRCRARDNAHGSDHEPIEAVFMLQYVERPQQPKLLFRLAPWGKIRAMVHELLSVTPYEPTSVESCAARIINAVDFAIQTHCPVSKPSPYSKKWWTVDLTAMRRAYVNKRNGARASRRAGNRDWSLEQAVTSAGKAFYAAARRQKRTHWNDFLADTTNIWKAAKYLHPGAGSAFTKIPALQTPDGTTTDDEEIAVQLIQDFFPPLPQRAQCDHDGQQSQQLPMEVITEQEIHNAILRISQDKAPGIDNKPTRVWTELWPTLRSDLTHLFRISIEQGRLASTWKTAKIVPLRKIGRPDYTISKAYRPISLLSNLGKILEGVVAERISYLVERYQLLPKHHFGARKQRSTTHALLLLQEAIWQAWRGKKTLTLASFDVKGAYNGVAKDHLLDQLRRRKIPEPMVRWIDDFCTNRKACVSVNGTTSKVYDLPQAGLPQGSPLSPILFLFFNAELLQHSIPHGGSLGFVDDITTWVVGSSAEENTSRIQQSVIPMLERWETSSGATFEAEKTQFLHFPPRGVRTELCSTPIRFKNEDVNPKEQAKILGLTMDQKLNFKTHLAIVGEKARHAALAIKRLRGLRSSTARQLYTSTVAPVTDYAAPVWFPKATQVALRELERGQRIGAQAITASFRTVALPTAEAEAGLLPIRERQYCHISKFWIDLHALPAIHPCTKLRYRPTRRFKSPLMMIAEWMRPIDITSMEKIQPFCIPPWQQTPSCSREGQPVTNHEITVYTKGSVRKGVAGIGIQSTPLDMRISETIGKSDDVTTHFTALKAIERALVALLSHRHTRRIEGISVFTNNRTALCSIQRPRHQSGQSTLQNIINCCRKLPNVKLKWVPTDGVQYGNTQAARLAKSATTDTAVAPPSGSIVNAAIRRKAKKHKPLVDSYNNATSGRFTRLLDKALPGRHVRLLYDSLTRHEAATLSQLRTSRCRLNSYLFRINIAPSASCACGEEETVQHFIFTCPLWASARALLRTAIEPTRWGDLPYLLGGWTNATLDGEKGFWTPNMTAVRATIAFAIETTRLDYKPDIHGTPAYNISATTPTS